VGFGWRRGEGRGKERDELVVIAFAEIPQPDLVEIVDSQTASDGVYEVGIIG
jgi:hypothetical protein